MKDIRFALPRVKTAVPGPISQQLWEKRKSFVPDGVFHVTEIFVAEAAGAMIRDVDDNIYVDFAGGIGVLNAGSTPPEVVEAIKDQAGRYLHTCFHVLPYEPYVTLAERLTYLVPGQSPKKAFLANSGAEAVENAIKIARRYTGRMAVISLENAFHGRTYMAMSLTSKVNPYRAGFGPFNPEVYRIPSAYCYRCALGLEYPSCALKCADNLARTIELEVGPGNVAAVIVEPVQGEGGFIVPPPEFLPRVKAITEKYGALFIDDEIQAGLGRTGKMLAIEHYNVEPDLVLLAKSLGAGLPISAVVGKTEILDAVHYGGIGGTFGGNPVAARAALTVLEMMAREDLPARAQRVGEKVRLRFETLASRFDLIGEVRGLGAMVAMELVKDGRSREPATEATEKVIRQALERGLILMKAGIKNNVIRFLAPLTITDEQLEAGLHILEEALTGVSQEAGLRDLVGVGGSA
ncbi:MAG: 4-aminobutyrate--2-oxoglutarate transaminase [Firmicutes bacterium]|nr:4-aminobutyrate--2-oxoglutarate transaminase [Bacillota bacterium]